MAITLNCDCDDGLAQFSTLETLRSRMMVRLGYAAQKDNPPSGMLDLIDDFLRSAQTTLYKRYTQLQTERFFTWTLVAGQNMYDLTLNDQVEDETCTKTIDPLRLTWAGVQDLNNAWYPISEGIPPEFYTMNPNQGLPARFEIRQCLEVFPTPDAAYKIQLKGFFGLLPLEDEDDRTTIDSELVFLTALAAAKFHYGKDDAGVVKKEAEAYLGTLVAGKHGLKRYVPGAGPVAPRTKPTMTGFIP